MHYRLFDFKNISHDMGNMHPSLKKNIHLIEELHKEVACLSKKVDKGFVPSVLENITFEKFEKLERETEHFYSTMRLAQEDVTAIAKNTGISKEIIRNIKDHVFHQEHKLTGGIGRFDPDVDMMGAWQRLINNDFAQSDLLWLQHEFVESLIMNGLDVAYEEAHNIANKFYNWSSSLKGI